MISSHGSVYLSLSPHASYLRQLNLTLITKVFNTSSIDATMKYALVTGCSAGGIGAALCHELHTRDIHVFATARIPSKLGDLQRLPNLTAVALDVTLASSMTVAFDTVKNKTGGRLDFLVNNLGSQYVAPLLEIDLDEARRMYEVNVWGVVAVTQAFAPLLIAAKGTIVNMASISGSLPAP